ncbi:MFS transporter [Hyphococcus luteus]|uniref:MFS transporter n=1 Tax=Hyphococcus luteus TaxID=2058213 RepID=A0A2S7K376_9PROT|nr:MFS transporter [Marinicaulis flavus]PQA86953.1 MFS transporter [Marinicaulis flavus]
MSSKDPREILAQSPMGVFQIVAVGMCVLLNALDGFDVLSISFAAPGIAEEWGVQRGALGIVLSMELIGMAVGSVFLGGVADVVGRRPTILACLGVMGVGMALASTANGIAILSAYRFATGLGIGGVLAATNAMVAEYSNAKRKGLSVTIMAAGYPIGAIIGGTIASVLLAYFDWRAVFIFGAGTTFFFIPFIWFLLPESIEFLAQKRPAGALEKINATLKRMGHETVSALPVITEASKKIGVGRLFGPELIRTTALLTFAYFAHIMTFYFYLKWIPKIVVDMGFAPSLAGSVLVWANVGGATGAIVLGLLTLRFGMKGLVIGAMLFGGALVTLFGQASADLAQLSLIACVAGFFTNAAIVGLYAIFALAFPTEVRAGGTGFVIGVGRGGAALGPIIAGFLFESGFSLELVAVFMAMGSIFAAAALFLLPSKKPEIVAEKSTTL